MVAADEEALVTSHTEPDRPAPQRHEGESSPDDLLRQAWAIRHLLDDTAEDDHAARIRLTAARDGVHLAAARAWRARGWRPITEAPPAQPPVRSLLVAPVLTAGVAAWLSATWLGGNAGVLGLFVALTAIPLLAERAGRSQRRVRMLALGAGLVLGLHVMTTAVPASVVLLPATLLLLAVAAVGTHPERERPVPDHPGVTLP